MQATQMKWLLTALLIGWAFPLFSDQNLETPSFNKILELKDVQAVTLLPDGSELFAIIDDEILQWDLSDFALVHKNPTDGIVLDLAVTQNGLLVTAGQSWDPKTFRLFGAYSVAFLVENLVESHQSEWRGLELFDLRTNDKEADTEPTSDINELAIEQFSSIASLDGTIFLASAVSTELTLRDDTVAQSFGPQTDPFAPTLSCGPSTQISTLKVKGTPSYVSSSIRPEILEIGVLRASSDEPHRSECIDVSAFSGLDRSNEKTPRFSLLHKVIDIRDAESGQISSGLLILNPNSNELLGFSLDTFDGDVLISKLDNASLNLNNVAPKGGSFTLLSASIDGSEILIGSSLQNTVRRYEITSKKKFGYKGVLSLSNPIRKLDVSDDASTMIVVTGENSFNGLKEISIFKNMGKLRGAASIPIELPTVKKLQESLAEAGFRTGRVDSIAGDRTKKAAKAYIEGSFENLGEPGFELQKIKKIFGYIGAIYPSIIQ